MAQPSIMQTSRCANTLTMIIVAALAPVATSKAFLNAPMVVPHPSMAPHVHHLAEVFLEASLHDAVGGVSESSHATAGHSDLSKIERSLQSMWRALPRNAYDRVEVKALRYLIHRYFMRTSGLMIPGIEPTSSRLVNNTNLHFMDYIESTLGVGRDHHGFTLPEAAVVIATMEQLIFDVDERLLAEAYEQEALNEMALLSREEFENVLKTYVVMWVISEDRNGYESRGVIDRGSDPFWNEIGALVQGLIKGLEFDQHRSIPLHKAGAALALKHSLEDAHQIAGSITRNFMAYADSHCSDVKSELVRMDRDGSGRVPIADFYRAGATNRRFAEAESYLRELGALDETSVWRGPQVIIPNYVQAASNCVVRTDQYLLCCKNECEDILGEIEEAIGAPSATPMEILAVLGNMTHHVDFAEEVPRKGWTRRMTSRNGRLKTTQALQNELVKAADFHGGSVPLHGRLFAQFLHYHFPQECPFPHRAGTTKMVTPREFGVDEGVLQTSDMKKRAELKHQNTHLEEEDFIDEEDQLMDKHVMSQAHFEEDYSLSPLARATPSSQSPSSTSSRRLFGLLLAAGGVIALVVALVLTSDGGVLELRASFVNVLGLDQLPACSGSLVSSRKASLV